MLLLGRGAVGEIPLTWPVDIRCSRSSPTWLRRPGFLEISASMMPRCWSSGPTPVWASRPAPHANRQVVLQVGTLLQICRTFASVLSSF
jgi:hypothetical protein